MEGLKNIKISQLNGVGPKRTKIYHKLGIETAYDLIRFYPRTYIDYTKTVGIADSIPGEQNIIRAFVCKKLPVNRIRKGMVLYKAVITDGISIMTATFFNNNYAFERLELNKEYFFRGKVTVSGAKREISAPLFIPCDGDIRMQPIYHLTEDLTSAMVITNVKECLRLAQTELTEPIPAQILKDEELCGLNYALRSIHFPKNEFELEIARKRLVFEELFTLQIGMLLLKKNNKNETSVKFTNFELKNFFNNLPFELTGAQIRAIQDCESDIKRNKSMNRLIQGDVGSGKTAVAAAVCFLCANNGYQSAFMAPTEILASQHFDSMSKLLSGTGLNIALLTGSVRKAVKEEIKKGIGNGNYDIVIGTHALLQEDVEFKNLGLVVTDEQHRFGVSQRVCLSRKGDNPHVLIMSATPIPRTLALIIYGDLDVSIIDEMPKGRQIINTMAVSSEKRKKAFLFIKKLLDEGRQAYIVCPAIDENENDINSVSEYWANISKNDFKNYNVSLLHGRLKNDEKEEIMKNFKENRIQVLVSTTVVEVGVDVPNAAVMMIENAERFGLSQMHQLRGRVGRGEWKSYCILISDLNTGENMNRLKIMCETSDGFKISEEDLKQRGPGDFFGKRQHGLPKLKIADMIKDIEILKRTKKVAVNILESDPELNENKGIRFLTEELFKQNGEQGYN